MSQTETQKTHKQSENDRDSSKNIKVFFQLWSFVRPYKVTLFFAMLALVIGSSGMIFLGLSIRFLVDEGLSKGDPNLLDQSVVYLIILVVGLAMASFFRFYLVTWLGERVIADLRKALFNHSLSLDVAFFEITKASEIQSRLTTDTTLLQSVIGSSFSVAARNFLSLVGGLIMLMILSLKLTILVLIMVPLVLVPILIIGRKVRQFSRQTQDRIADLGSFSTESIDSVRTVQAFCHEEEEKKNFHLLTENVLNISLQRIRWRAILIATVMVLVFVGIASVLWIGGHDMMAGEITSGELSAFMFYAVIVATAAGAISDVAGEMQRAAGATERILEILAVKPEIAVPAKPKTLPLSQGKGGEIRFENLSFHYPARPDFSALNHFSLSVARGERLALVGPSGAGKSTIFSLLLRFYDPQDGQIVLDGVALQDLHPQEVRSRFALVPQDPVIFSANAWDNIRFGKPEASREEIRAAAQAALATEFLDHLPQGFDSFLGEKGVRLSGGQKQRISIARAILRNPEILLLDEATSALDAENERLVQLALDRVMEGRTSLTIAHRLATVRQMDRILVIDSGKVIDQGSHDQLIARGGLYADLAKLQFNQGKSLYTQR